MEQAGTPRRVALVTGGGSGIGEAVCVRLARDGMAVGVVDRDAAAAERVAAAILGAGGRAVAAPADVSSRAELAQAAAALRAAFGPVTVLVNNAGIEGFEGFAAIDEAAWDRIMAVNLKGPYLAAQEVVPDMIAEGWGRIVNLASLSAQTGAVRMAHYASSKGGVVALTRTLAVELGAAGITVNAVSPSFIDTPMARRAIAASAFPVSHEQIVRGYPIPRLGRPEEVAAACAFFASEDAGYVTGQLLGVNGGAAF